MVDMLKSSKEEDQRKREEAQLYSIQQQIDELRRQFKENLARQQWFEELYRQGEVKITQVQSSQDRLSQDVAHNLHARQIDEGRMKSQLAELIQRAEEPEKQIKELRAQFSEVIKEIRNDRDVDAADRKEVEGLQRQIRELNSAIALIGDGQRQLRDLIHELDSTIGEVRQEALHVAELQRMEEQRLRRQGVELQELVEAIRGQFNEVAAKSQRVDDVRRQLIERLETMEEQLATLHNSDQTAGTETDRLEKTENEHYLAQQERLEAARIQLETQISEMRQMGDQRMERYTARFAAIDERIRSVEQLLAEVPARFESLERRDETIGAEADTIEEWLVQRQLAALEHVLEEVRARRVERADVLKPKPVEPPRTVRGSVYNPAGLLRSVKDAKPPRKDQPKGDDE